MLAKELQNRSYNLLVDSQDLNDLCNYFPFLPKDEITGAIVLIEEGDYREVFVTESNEPYNLYAHYEHLTFYEQDIRP